MGHCKFFRQLNCPQIWSRFMVDPRCTQPRCTYVSAFQEGHPVNLVVKLVSKLFFDGSPSIAKIVNFLRAHELYGGVTLQNQVKCLVRTPTVHL